MYNTQTHFRSVRKIICYDRTSSGHNETVFYIYIRGRTAENDSSGNFSAKASQAIETLAMSFTIPICVTTAIITCETLYELDSWWANNAFRIDIINSLLDDNETSFSVDVMGGWLTDCSWGMETIEWICFTGPVMADERKTKHVVVKRGAR